MNSFPVILLVVLLGGSGPMTCYANGQANLAVEDVEAWREAYEEAWEKLGPEKAALKKMSISQQKCLRSLEIPASHTGIPNSHKTHPGLRLFSTVYSS